MRYLFGFSLAIFGAIIIGSTVNLPWINTLLTFLLGNNSYDYCD